MRKYNFHITICEGNDEFWEQVEKPEDITNEVKAVLESNGFDIDDIFLHTIDVDERILPDAFEDIFKAFRKRC
jgi:hypothetical protein